jgi:hypothetical protein
MDERLKLLGDLFTDHPEVLGAVVSYIEDELAECQRSFGVTPLTEQGVRDMIAANGAKAALENLRNTITSLPTQFSEAKKAQT